ncbi:MAG: sodium/proline symporter [Flavobacteriales bacterium]|nr:sodium/proline symporter [Flavobacteriales bacterium]
MNINYIVLFIYFLILFLIGVFASKKIKGLEDYYVGGKKLGYWVVAFSARATGESAWLLLGLTGLGAMIGVSAFWVVVGELLGVGAAWFLMARPFKALTDEYGSITVPDYLVSRFKSSSHLLRIVAAATLTIFVTIYVSAQIDATGKAFETFLEWNYYTGVFVGFGIVVMYILSGGFVAVAWSDLFQGLLMLMGLVLLPIVTLIYLGPEADVLGELERVDPGLVNIWGAGGFSMMNLMAILGLAGIGLGFMGSPQLFVRFMSIKDDDEILKGRWVAIVFTFLTDSAAVLIGILGRYLFTEQGQAPDAILGNGAEQVLPMLVDLIMPSIIIAMYIAVVLAAIMSTIDSLLVVASSAIARDFYQQIYNPDLKNEKMAKISRVITVTLALAALVLALTIAELSPTRTVFWFVIFGWSGIAATFCPMMILSLFWKGYTEKGALASMISGFLSIPIFKFLMTQIPDYGMYFEKLAELPPSFVIALLFGIFVSKLDKKAKSSS